MECRPEARFPLFPHPTARVEAWTSMGIWAADDGEDDDDIEFLDHDRGGLTATK